MIDPALLERWIGRFFGYGSWSAPYWFIGLEEGGVDSGEQFQIRLDAWHAAGEPSLVDLHNFHLAIGAPQHTRPGAALQRTWRPLLRALFCAKGSAPFDNAALRSYQIERLGRSGGETSLLELSPLPAVSTTRRWFQRDPANPMCRIDLEAVKHARRAALTSAIDEHHPKAVITYGDRRGWADHFALRPMQEYFVGARGRTILVASHQGRQAPLNAHWDSIGSFIAGELRKRSSGLET